MSRGPAASAAAPGLPEARRRLLDLLLAAQQEPAAAERRIGRRQPGQEIPLTFAQLRLWLLHQMDPHSSAYNVVAAEVLAGPLAAACLATGVAEVVRRHEILRSTFALVGDTPRQEVGPPYAPPLPQVDLRNLSDPPAEARRLVAAAARRPFDLARGPLLRLLLLRTADELHVLVVVQHHIASDAWSAEIFRREVTTLYASLAAGRPSPLPDLPIQYGDFACWQRAQAPGEALAAHLDYWRRQLAGLAPLLALPGDRPRPAVRSGRGAVALEPLAGALLGAARALARRRGATLFMVVLAVFKALLGRYAGCADVAVGTPVANRERPEISGLIGLFADTLLLRSSLAGEPDLLTMMDRVRDVTLAAFAHQDLPFEQLVNQLGVERDPSYTPLFQVWFALQHLESAAAPPAAPVVPFVTTGTARCDLSLFCDDAGEAGRLAAEYSTDLFDRPTIARLLGHCRALLGAAVQHPDRPLGTLDLVGEGERQLLLVEANAEAGAAAAAPVLQQLAEWAARQPAAAAVLPEDGGEDLTYGELDRRSDLLARFLRGSGIGSEEPVGILLERSPLALVAAVAVLKAGGACLPLDPASPGALVGWMVRDAGASLLLTEASLRGAHRDAERGGLAAGIARVLELDTQWTDLAAASGPGDLPGAAAGQLAYVLYAGTGVGSGGAAGQPAGVEVRHGGLANLVAWHRRLFGLAPADRTTWLAGMGSGQSLLEIWPTLCSGASLHPMDGMMASPSPYLPERLAARRITVSCLPTPLVADLLAQGWPPDLTLRTVLATGDRLHAAVPRQLPFALWILCQPGTSAVATAAAVRGGSGGPVGGRAIDGLSVHLLDGGLQLVPLGVRGEICVGGDGVARGFRGAPALTAERFVPDPFTPRPGGRLYRTGDLARRRGDGSLELLGPGSRHVELRGCRVDLGLVESALALLPGVRAGAVERRQDEGGRLQLVAHIVPSGRAAPPDGQLRGLLKERLPAYMVPAAYQALRALPLTGDGQLDLQRLPAPAPVPTAAAAAPHGWREEELARVWADVLGTAVGVHDNFFALGGDSVQAIRVVVRANERGLRITPRQLFENPTIASLAAAAAGGAEARAVEAPPMPPGAAADHPAGAPIVVRPPRAEEINSLVAAARLGLSFTHEAGAPPGRAAGERQATARSRPARPGGSLFGWSAEEIDDIAAAIARAGGGE